MTQTNMQSGKSRPVRDHSPVRPVRVYDGPKVHGGVYPRLDGPVYVHETPSAPTTSLAGAAKAKKTATEAKPAKGSRFGFKTGVAVGTTAAVGTAVGVGLATGAITGEDIADGFADAGEDVGEAIVDAAEDVADFVTRA